MCNCASKWKPGASTTWQLQLTGTLNTNYNVTAYDADLVDTSAASIAKLKAAGRKVVCYFSAGSAENWLDIRSANVRAVMVGRLDLAKAKGCDGVDADNVDGYTHRTGFALTAQDQLDYNRFLADQAHARNLAIGLKNAVEQLSALEPWFDFAINEQCHEYSECGGYSVFLSKNKPVLNVEYKREFATNSGGARDRLCAASAAMGMHTLVLPLPLDGTARYSCNAI